MIDQLIEDLRVELQTAYADAASKGRDLDRIKAILDYPENVNTMAIMTRDPLPKHLLEMLHQIREVVG